MSRASIRRWAILLIPAALPASFALCAWGRRRGHGLLDLCRLAWLGAAVSCAAGLARLVPVAARDASGVAAG